MIHPPCFAHSATSQKNGKEKKKEQLALPQPSQGRVSVCSYFITLSQQSTIRTLETTSLSVFFVATPILLPK